MQCIISVWRFSKHSHTPPQFHTCTDQLGWPWSTHCRLGNFATKTWKYIRQESLIGCVDCVDARVNRILLRIICIPNKSWWRTSGALYLHLSGPFSLFKKRHRSWAGNDSEEPTLNVSGARPVFWYALLRGPRGVKLTPASVYAS